MNLAKAQDAISDFVVRSLDGSKIVGPSSQVELKFTSPEQVFIESLEINSHVMEGLSFTCKNYFCHYTYQGFLPNGIKEGEILFHIRTPLISDLGSFYYELNSDLIYKADYKHGDTKISLDPVLEEGQKLASDNNTEINDSKSDPNIPISQRIIVEDFDIKASREYAVVGDTVNIVLRVQNLKDEIDYISIFANRGRIISKQVFDNYYEIVAEVDLISGLPESPSEIGFELSLNGQKATNFDFNIPSINFTSLELADILAYSDFKFLNEDSQNIIKFKIPSSYMPYVEIQSLTLNSVSDLALKKECIAGYCYFKTYELLALDYKNSVSLDYSFAGQNARYDYEFKDPSKITIEDMSEELEILKVSFPDASINSNLGKAVIVLDVKDTTEDLSILRRVLLNGTYSILQSDTETGEVKLAYELNLEGKTQIDLQLNSGDKLTLSDNKLIPYISSDNSLTPIGSKKSVINKFKLDKKSRFVLKGRNLQAGSRLYLLNTNGEFEQVTLRKMNKKARKHFIKGLKAVPENAIYALYISENRGYSFIRLGN